MALYLEQHKAFRYYNGSLKPKNTIEADVQEECAFSSTWHELKGSIKGWLGGFQQENALRVTLLIPPMSKAIPSVAQQKLRHFRKNVDMTCMTQELSSGVDQRYETTHCNNSNGGTMLNEISGFVLVAMEPYYFCSVYHLIHH